MKLPRSKYKTNSTIDTFQKHDSDTITCCHCARRKIRSNSLREVSAIARTGRAFDTRSDKAEKYCDIKIEPQDAKISSAEPIPSMVRTVA